MTVPRFHPLVPGGRLAGDWFNAQIPTNLLVGSDVVLDSSFCFKHFYSKLSFGLRVGNRVSFWRTSLATEERAYIEIGDDCYLANASLVCAERISIGSGVMISGGVTIADSDFHPISPALRLADSVALSPAGERSRRPRLNAHPVVIEDDVWVGFNAVILKGVHIGAGALISPGAVVIRDVPAGAVVSGNPAVVQQPERSL